VNPVFKTKVFGAVLVVMDALEHSDLTAIRKYTILGVAAVKVRRRLSGMRLARTAEARVTIAVVNGLHYELSLQGSLSSGGTERYCAGQLQPGEIVFRKD
jgi:hypothetical protein